jgi:hypothetical protein
VPAKPKPKPARDIASTKCSIILISYGKTGRPVVGGKGGGIELTHHPFIHAVPNGQGGWSTPHRTAFGSPIKDSRIVK